MYLLIVFLSLLYNLLFFPLAKSINDLAVFISKIVMVTFGHVFV